MATMKDKLSHLERKGWLMEQTIRALVSNGVEWFPEQPHKGGQWFTTIGVIETNAGPVAIKKVRYLSQQQMGGYPHPSLTTVSLFDAQTIAHNAADQFPGSVVLLAREHVNKMKARVEV